MICKVLPILKFKIKKAMMKTLRILIFNFPQFKNGKNLVFVSYLLRKVKKTLGIKIFTTLVKVKKIYTNLLLL
jgi:hypothetical protein